jgi:hypothetical protein
MTKRKKKDENKQNHGDSWNTTKLINISIISIPEEEERERCRGIVMNSQT